MRTESFWPKDKAKKVLTMNVYWYVEYFKIITCQALIWPINFFFTKASFMNRFSSGHPKLP